MANKDCTALDCVHWTRVDTVSTGQWWKRYPASSPLSAFGIDRLQYLKYLCNARKRSLLDPNHGNLAVENKFCFVVTARCQIWGSIELHCLSKTLTHLRMTQTGWLQIAQIIAIVSKLKVLTVFKPCHKSMLTCNHSKTISLHNRPTNFFF